VRLGPLVLNLLTDRWLPVIRRRSGRCIIRLAQITESLDKDPVIATDWPRPDFRIATMELLVGLLATAFPPEDNDTWLDWWHEPPTPAALDGAFAPFSHAFTLDGAGPRFLQDLENLDSSPKPIERLLIEAPGEGTINRNTDLMVHRGQVARLGRATAAIALYTLQSWAPAGGAGNRVGLRGGGPLVTMVLPGAAATLWQTLWANVPAGGRPPTRDEMRRVFPWLAPTVISDGTMVVTPKTAHPLQCWWGMPRRIRLDFVASEMPQSCDLTGELDGVHVVSWRQRQHGASYAAWGGVHPLTPHYRQTPGGEKLAVHPQLGGIGYHHWLGLVLRTKDGLRAPASAVSLWYGGRDRNVGVRNSRLIAAGFDMENMKARGFVECEMPLPAASDKISQSHLEALAYDLVMASNQVASLLHSAVRNALFSAGAIVKPDAALLSAVRERLWNETGTDFFSVLESAAQCASDIPDGDRVGWLKRLRRIALALFDEAAPLTHDSGGAVAMRISRERRFLGFALAGFGLAGTTLFATLQLPAAKPEETKKKAKVA
jgi:CRISPR system Cascade subunit CasA